MANECLDQLRGLIHRDAKFVPRQLLLLREQAEDASIIARGESKRWFHYLPLLGARRKRRLIEDFLKRRLKLWLQRIYYHELTSGTSFLHRHQVDDDDMPPDLAFCRGGTAAARQRRRR